MSGLDDFDLVVPRPNQLWYVAHPVHPMKEEVEAYRIRENEMISHQRSAYEHARSPGFVVERRKADREVLDVIIRGNIANAKLWLSWLIRRYPSVTFIAPWIAALDGGGDDDLDPEQRRRGLRDCCRTISRCDGMVHVGGRVSGGMSQEAGSARWVIDLTYLGRTPPAGDPFRLAHAPSSEDSR